MTFWRKSFDAIIISETQKSINPILDSSNAIRNTPLQKNLKLKIGAKIMLTYNVDTIDCLTNGAFGEVIGFQYGKGNDISKVIVHFFDENCGKEKRKRNGNLENLYPGMFATPIERIEFPYSFSRKSNCGAKNAKVIQFPIRLAFAATAHKVQGQTTKKPNALVVDFKSVREPGQAYVMMSRVESLCQLFIIDSLPVEKIYASSPALSEHGRNLFK